jgi:hypothetical protein
VPGLLARDRQHYAQDVQISVRGFGARSTFGIRGVRLYVDGIPVATPKSPCARVKSSSGCWSRVLLTRRSTCSIQTAL